ncbi:DUF2860 family protein [Vibrio metschnikovii]|uniref:DUF2860 family protein n=1 Tax=Vibrio metschnikovii TaxID=28172 RepID=UPI001648AE70|nr:DUF2860 family protein [Vibrio metschnikovii]MBC3616077.1 DUF2860 family protein [Vibrio metschnikovii]MBC5811718.1 DUF2860 family protein [Vibrio metschnikovii]
MNINGLALCFSSALLIPSLQAKPIKFNPEFSSGTNLNTSFSHTNSQFNTLISFPALNLHQDYKAFGVFTVCNDHHPSALQNTQFNVITKYQQHELDIVFYDSESNCISMIINYTF